jgi:hypothetical protein
MSRPAGQASNSGFAPSSMPGSWAGFLVTNHAPTSWKLETATTHLLFAMLTYTFVLFFSFHVFRSRLEANTLVFCNTRRCRGHFGGLRTMDRGHPLRAGALLRGALSRRIPRTLLLPREINIDDVESGQTREWCPWPYIDYTEFLALIKVILLHLFLIPLRISLNRLLNGIPQLNPTRSSSSANTQDLQGTTLPKRMRRRLETVGKLISVRISSVVNFSGHSEHKLTILLF